VKDWPGIPEHLWMGRGVVVLRTESPHGGRALRLEFRPAEPPDDWSAWDWVAEADLRITSGHLGVGGMGPEEWPAYTLASGDYRVRVSVDDVRKADPAGRGAEVYRVQLFPVSEPRGYVVHKEGGRPMSTSE
jgi:hypothetical protein